MVKPTLDAAIEMLGTILPPGRRIAVHDVQWHARDRGIGWRTVNEAKRRAGNIRAVKQRGRHKLPWIWVRE
jgi:hypothetical protein